MSSKLIEDYTDKELENAIKLHQTELKKNKDDFVNMKKDQSALELEELHQVIMYQEDLLRKLMKERERRKSYDNLLIV